MREDVLREAMQQCARADGNSCWRRHSSKCVVNFPIKSARRASHSSFCSDKPID